VECQNYTYKTNAVAKGPSRRTRKFFFKVRPRRNSNFILQSSVNARASVRQCAHWRTDALADGSQL